ncbi:MAG TPA: hypothetical protein VI565_11395, partial [Burkholderiales bacterium]|nr:hypothetical protein [Burkholderiales bacterium]
AQAGWNVTYVATLPRGWTFTEARDGTLEDGGNRATWTISNWNGLVARESSSSVTLRDGTLPANSAADARVTVTVDMKDVVGIAFPAVLSGDLGSLRMELTVDGDLRVLPIPSDLQAKMPAGVSLPFVSADAIRIALAAGVLTVQDVDAFEQSLLQSFKEGVSSAVGGTFSPRGGIDRSTLAQSLISIPADATPPIKFSATGSVQKDLSRRAGAVTFYSFVQQFSLSAFQGLPTTYTIVFPRGLAVSSLQAPGAQVVLSSTGGRDSASITPEGGSVRTTAILAITETFLIEKFWYVLLAFVLVALLIVIGVVMLVRRRRGGRGKAAEAPSTDDGSEAPT